MKRIIIFSVILFASLTFNAEAKKHFNGVGGYFYSQLAPYGTWIEVDYGVVVWRPTIIRVKWMPYQMGRWVWTYDGWYWDSYEPFGFITYHYGRWYYDDYYGWLWYPDYEWAPAWVEWRYSNNYIGWAPLHPYAAFSVSVGIYYTNVYYTPYYHYNYVTYVNFCDPYVYNYYVASGPKYRVHKGTKTRHNFVYYNGRVQNRGVDVKYVSSRSGQKIKQRDIVRVSDSRELNRDGYRDQDKIRTLEVSRDQLMRNDVSRMEIKRDNRKTSVDMEKVKIGRNDKVTNEVRYNKSKDRKVGGLKTDQKRKDGKSNNRIIENNRTIENRKINQNVQRETKSERTVKNNREVISRNETQVKKQNGNLKKESDVMREKQERTVNLKNEKSKVSKEQKKQTRVRQSSENNVKQKRDSDKKQNDERTKGNDNSKERKRR